MGHTVMKHKSDNQYADSYEYAYRKMLYPFYEGIVRQRNTHRYLVEYERDQWRSLDELKAIQWSKTASLLKFSYEHVPYYRARWAAAGIHWQDIKSIEDFARLPLLTKDDIRNNYDGLVAGPFKGQNYRKKTGGSTGQPLAFEYTQESNQRRQAVMMRDYAWAGARPARRTAYVWGADIGKLPLATRIKSALHNRLLRRKMLNSFVLSDSNIDKYLDEIDRYRPDVLVGYVSPLHLLARHRLKQGGSHWQPQTIVTGAEGLLEFQRRDLELAFGCKVFNTYGCREFMSIAAECPEHKGLHINMDHLVVELLDPNDQPAQSGQVVITDLHNYGMPFIRYVNGDLATGLAGTCTCGRQLPRLASVEGRKLDVIRTQDGRMLAGEFFPHLMKDIPGVEKFQVVQTNLRKLAINIVRDVSFNAESMKFLDIEIRKVLGGGIDIQYKFVSSIPLTSSGKLRVTISELSEATA